MPDLSTRSLFLVMLFAVALRLWFFIRFQELQPDSLIYGDIAKTWLLHGVYGMTPAGVLTPTLIRVPGYPAFLAVIFFIFGIEHYNAVSFVQIGFDIATCFVVADLARRTVSKSAGTIAFVLCATCPFLANYAGAVLTETLAMFFAALTLDLAVVGFDALESDAGFESASRTRWQSWKIWTACGAAIAASILLRPDGGILLITVGGYLLLRLVRGPRRRQMIVVGVILTAASLAPLVPWTWRNWRTFHIFQPIAPAEANDPGEFVPRGFIRWEHTWLVDYASKMDISFKLDDDYMYVADLPSRAIDSAEERRRTEQLFAEYNEEVEITPELDEKFAALAADRIRRAPLRYYIWLPTLRALNLWFRARTEDLPIDSHFLVAMQDPAPAAVTVGFIVLNFWYCAVAWLGLARAGVRYAGLLAGFWVVRTLFMGAISLPEPRYVLECYPVVLVLAAAGVASFFPTRSSSRITAQSFELSS